MGSIAARLGKALSVGGEMMFQIGMEEKRADLTAKRDANLAAIQTERDKVNIDAQNTRLDRDIASREASDKLRTDQWQQTFDQTKAINTGVQARLDKEAGDRHTLAKLEIGSAERAKLIEEENSKHIKSYWAADPTTPEGIAQRDAALTGILSLASTLPVEEKPEKVKLFEKLQELGWERDAAATGAGIPLAGDKEESRDIQLAKLLVKDGEFEKEGQALTWLLSNKTSEGGALITAAYNMALQEHEDAASTDKTTLEERFSKYIKIVSNERPRPMGPKSLRQKIPPPK